MRNPIQPSPDRPLPLPDCILMDAWWADLRDDETPPRRERDTHLAGDVRRDERELRARS